MFGVGCLPSSRSTPLRLRGELYSYEIVKAVRSSPNTLPSFVRTENCLKHIASCTCSLRRALGLGTIAAFRKNVAFVPSIFVGESLAARRT